MCTNLLQFSYLIYYKMLRKYANSSLEKNLVDICLIITSILFDLIFPIIVIELGF